MTKEEFILELERLGITPTEEQLEQLEKFYNILIETNKVMNLTRIVEKEEVYLKHFYDSLTVIKIYDLDKFESLCDIGTGAGFPGIVLKIFYPNLKITLVDALQKRINYLNKVIEELDLKDIEAIHQRAEDLIREGKSYDIVVARAVASLPKLLSWTMPLVKNNGVFIAMKGNLTDELELASTKMKEEKCTLEKKINFLLPKEESKRTLLLFRKNQ